MKQRGSQQMRLTKIKNQNKKEKKIAFLIITIVAVVIGGGVIAFYLISPNQVTPNMEVVNFHEYHNLNENNIYIVLEGDLLTDFVPLNIDEELHLPYNFLEFDGPHLHWEADYNLLTITTQTELIRIHPGDNNLYLNHEPQLSNFMVQNINNIAYLPLSFIEERFDINAHLTSSNLLLIEKTTTPILATNVITYEGHIRHLPDIQSPIVEILTEGSNLRIVYNFENSKPEYEDQDIYTLNDENNYTRVITASGAVGYINNNEISQEIVENEGFTRQQLLPRNTSEEPLIIAWDLITNTAANYLPNTRIVHQGVNVMAPKWLRFERENYSGTLENISSLDYVNWAHSNGMQVWPLLFDYEDPLVATEILSQPMLRDYVIHQLIEIAQAYNFDGIMIDIEGTNASNQGYFLQFLRELSPIMRQHDLIYSIAVFVPAPWREWYNHKEIGRVVDFVAVMAYDQNVASVANRLDGATAGPNASISFVTNAVQDLVAVMDSRQIIVGLPFYTRIWYIRNVDGQNVYTDRPVGIQFGQNYFANAGAHFYWSEYYGSYFASFITIEDGEEVVTQAWLETERSLDLKSRLVNEYDLAGVAGWQRALSTPGVWAVLYDSLMR